MVASVRTHAASCRVKELLLACLKVRQAVHLPVCGTNKKLFHLLRNTSDAVSCDVSIIGVPAVPLGKLLLYVSIRV